MAQAQVPYRYMQQVLYAGYSLNMQSTADQALVKCFNGTDYVIRAIVARQRTGACSISCLGGLYDSPGKAGNAVIAATQSWVTLASGIIVNATLAALTQTTLLTSDLILSLTTGSTAACTADLFVFGLDVT